MIELGTVLAFVAAGFVLPAIWAPHQEFGPYEQYCVLAGITARLFPKVYFSVRKLFNDAFEKVDWTETRTVEIGAAAWLIAIAWWLVIATNIMPPLIAILPLGYAISIYADFIPREKRLSLIIVALAAYALGAIGVHGLLVLWPTSVLSIATTTAAVIGIAISLWLYWYWEFSQACPKRWR
jgi:hypothetical protein